MMTKIKLFSVMLLVISLASCGKYSSDEKAALKAKVFAMYEQVPKMDVTNAATYDFVASNTLCKDIITKDPVLTNFFNDILKDQKSEKGEALTLENANFTSLPVQLMVDEALDLSEEEFTKIKVADIF